MKCPFNSHQTFVTPQYLKFSKLTSANRDALPKSVISYFFFEVFLFALETILFISSSSRGGVQRVLFTLDSSSSILNSSNPASTSKDAFLKSVIFLEPSRIKSSLLLEKVDFELLLVEQQNQLLLVPAPVLE